MITVNMAYDCVRMFSLLLLLLVRLKFLHLSFVWSFWVGESQSLLIENDRSPKNWGKLEALLLKKRRRRNNKQRINLRLCSLFFAFINLDNFISRPKCSRDSNSGCTFSKSPLTHTHVTQMHMVFWFMDTTTNSNVKPQLYCAFIGDFNLYRISFRIDLQSILFRFILFAIFDCFFFLFCKGDRFTIDFIFFTPLR